MTPEATIEQLRDVFDEQDDSGEFVYIACITHLSNVDRLREVSDMPIWVSPIHPKETTTLIAGGRGGADQLLRYIEREQEGDWK